MGLALLTSRGQTTEINLEPASEPVLCRRPCAGRGLNPRPERSTPAKYPPTIPKPERHPPKPIFQLFPILYSSALAWMDRSGRGFNPRPAQGRPERSTPAKYPPTIPKPERHPRNQSFNCFLSSAPLLSRGWIVPVGGATPDRQRPTGAGDYARGLRGMTAKVSRAFASSLRSPSVSP